MNEYHTKLQKELRGYTSSEAFDWLVSRFSPNNSDSVGTVLMLIAHRSWRKPEQIKLFDTYFSKSFPSGRSSLEVFSKIMSLKALAIKLEDFRRTSLRNDHEKLGLASYRLNIFVENIANVEDRKQFLPIIDAMKEVYV